MKNKLLAATLGILLAIGCIGISVSKVSAEPDMESSVEAEETEESAEAEEEETVPEEDADTVPEEDAEAEEKKEEETEVKAESEEKEADAEITGMKITLENELQADIISIEVAAFSNEVYSENLLKKDQIFAAGESCTIGIPEEFQDADLGMYNVRITLADGSIQEIPLVPLLENVIGTVYPDNGIVLIRVRDERLEAEAEPVSEAEIQQTEAEASQIMAEILSAELE